MGIAPPSNAVAVLGSMPLFAEVPDEELLALAAGAHWCELPGGATLFREGDPADAAYVVASGRLEASSGDTVVRVIGEGEVTGEAGLLEAGSRSATVAAVRDSVLARIDSSDLERLATRHPGVALGLARSVAARLRVDPSVSRRLRPPCLVAAVAVADDVDLSAFVAALVAACPTDTTAVVVDGSAGTDTVARAIELEVGADLVVIVVSPDDVEWVCRQADLVVMVGRVGSRPSRTASSLGAVTRPAQLLLTRRPGAAPTTRGWDSLADGVAANSPVVHVEDGSSADLARFGRCLTGRSVGVVLGGGGARGFAHIGVLRALAEAGVTIDRVGGSSMGSIIGAQLALGWSAERMLEENSSRWSRRMLAEVRWPSVSLASGERASALFRAIFGDRRIEELLLDYFCTTADLTASRLHIADRGPVADWVGASSAVPGLWPPSADSQGHLHSDGGILDNVPTAVMRSRSAGPVIAVDVCSQQAPMLVVPASGHAALAPLRRRRGTGADGGDAPSMLELLNRSNLLASVQSWQTARAHADLYLTPSTGTHGFASFDRVSELADLGYSSTLRQLTDVDLDGLGQAPRSHT